MTNGIIDYYGIGNLNDGITELEAKVLRLKGSEEPENHQEIQNLVVKIDHLKRKRNEAFF